mmetsp:Transcript_18400/g.43241  ORF Transcript_18400/g.43241 Transcript_18400/m.43241 type:complete len:86 (+) Transcript_18400:392-649(+)
MPMKNIVLCTMQWEGVLFALLPLWIATCSWVSAKQLHLTGISEVVYLACSFALVQTVFIWFTMSLEDLYMSAKEKSWFRYGTYTS